MTPSSLGASAAEVVTAAATVDRVAARKPAESVAAAIARVEKITDPAKRALAAHELLEALTAGRDRVSQIRRGATAELHERDGWTVDDVAELLDVSRGRAHQIIRGVARWTTGR